MVMAACVFLLQWYEVAAYKRQTLSRMSHFLCFGGGWRALFFFKLPPSLRNKDFEPPSDFHIICHSQNPLKVTFTNQKS